MELTTLADAVGRWLYGGLSALSDPERQAIRKLYFDLLGLPQSPCKNCQWEDILHTMQMHLRTNNISIMKPNYKYIVKGGGSLHIPYMNLQVTSFTLTDERAELILSRFPGYLGEHIVENPDYVTPVAEPELKLIRKDVGEPAATIIVPESPANSAVTSTSTKKSTRKSGKKLTRKSGKK